MIAHDNRKPYQPFSRTITGHASQYEVAVDLSTSVADVLHLWATLKANSATGLYIKFTDSTVYFPHEIADQLKLLNKSNTRKKH